MWKPRRQHRRTPYYKVQVFDNILQSWSDVRRAFDTSKAARAYISESLCKRETRIMVIEEQGRHVLYE